MNAPIRIISFLLLVIITLLVISNCSKEENPIIPEKPELNLIYPVGGESFPTDTTIKIKWSSTFVDSISIHFSTNSGTSWSEIVSSVSAELGEWEWITPHSILDSCKIKIVSKSDVSINDESNSNFSIFVDVTLDLLAPNGGEVWESLTDYSITWMSENIDSIFIECTSDNGDTWQIIDTVGASYGNFIWNTHYQPSEHYKIRIISTEIQSLQDESENPFTIVISPKVTESLNYYPLAIGNKWFYRKTFINHHQEDTTISYLVREVTKYVMMGNYKHYFLISSDEYPYSSNERLDSLKGLVYQYNSFVLGDERLYDDLITEPGNLVYTWRFFDGIGPGTNILDEYTDIILGLNTTTRFYGPMNDEVQRNYKLSKKIGLTYWWIQYWNTTNVEITGAIIDGVVYGDTTLPANIDRLK